MKTDVLFINPPYGNVFGTLKKASGRFPPLGIAYLAACLEKEGYNVKINDFDADGAEPKKAIKAYKPKIMAMTSTSPVFKEAIDIAKYAKKKGCDTIIGGPHPTAVPKITMRNNCFDYLIYGEGEETIQELMACVEKRKDSSKSLKKVNGIVFRDNKKIRKTKPRKLIKDLDSIPFPAYSLLPIDKYRFYSFFDNGKRFSTMITKRGCPLNCIFCNTKTIFGSSLRFRSAKNIVDEMELINDKYRIKEVYFYDDTMTINKKHVMDFCNELKKRRLDMRWSTETRVDKVDLGLLQKMKKNNCYMMGYGFESGDQRILDRIGKRVTVRQNIMAARLTKKSGMLCRGYFILGCPGETSKSIIKTINFPIKYKIDFAHYNIMTPYPDTQIWEMGLKEKKLSIEDAENSGAVANVLGTKKIVGSELSQKEVKQYWIKAHMRFYLRPSFIWNLTKKIENTYQAKRIAESGLEFFSGILKIKNLNE